MVYINKKMRLKRDRMISKRCLCFFLRDIISKFQYKAEKVFQHNHFNNCQKKTFPLAGLRTALSLLALQQHLSQGCKAITTQGPWGWTLSCYANKVLFTFISCSKGTRTWFMCGQVLKQIWKYIFKLSMKTNIWQLGQNQYTQDVCSLLFYLQSSGTIWGGCIALNGFSSTITEKFKEDHKLLLMIFFKVYFIMLVFLLVLCWFPGSFPLCQRDAQEALADVLQHKSNHRFSELSHETGRRQRRSRPRSSSQLPPKFLYGLKTHLGKNLHKCLHINPKFIGWPHQVPLAECCTPL